MAVVVEHQNARKLLRDFIRGTLADTDEIESDTVITEAHERFASDRSFRDQFFDDVFHSVVSGELEAVVRSMRLTVYEDGTISNGVDVGHRAKDIAARIFENIGDGRRKTILAMTRIDLLAAVSIRSDTVRGHLRWIKFEKALASEMKSDETRTVREVFTDERFQELWDETFKTTGLD